jgi:hypothetical protein
MATCRHRRVEHDRLLHGKQQKGIRESREPCKGGASRYNHSSGSRSMPACKDCSREFYMSCGCWMPYAHRAHASVSGSSGSVESCFSTAPSPLQQHYSVQPQTWILDLLATTMAEKEVKADRALLSRTTNKTGHTLPCVCVDGSIHIVLTRRVQHNVGWLPHRCSGGGRE